MQVGFHSGKRARKYTLLGKGIAIVKSNKHTQTCTITIDGPDNTSTTIVLSLPELRQLADIAAYQHSVKLDILEARSDRRSRLLRHDHNNDARATHVYFAMRANGIKPAAIVKSLA